MVCGAAAALVPCTVGPGRGRTVRSALDPANTLVDGVVAFGAAAVARLTLFWVTCLEFLVTEDEDKAPPQVPLAVNGWLKTISKWSA